MSYTNSYNIKHKLTSVYCMTRSLLQYNQVGSNITTPNKQSNHLVLSVLVYGMQTCVTKRKQNIKLKAAATTFVTKLKQNLKQVSS